MYTVIYPVYTDWLHWHCFQFLNTNIYYNIYCLIYFPDSLLCSRPVLNHILLTEEVFAVHQLIVDLALAKKNWTELFPCLTYHSYLLNNNQHLPSIVYTSVLSRCFEYTPKKASISSWVWPTGRKFNLIYIVGNF